jgi:hypothetical protein
MRNAICPVTKGFRDFDEILFEFKGSRYDMYGICPFCEDRMHPRGGRQRANAHFSHYSGACCPSIERADTRWNALSPRRPSQEQRRLNREFVRSNIDAIWFMLTNQVPYLSIEEFVNMLGRAREIDLYAHSGLTREQVPYSLLTLVDFNVNTSYKRERKFKFFFFYKGLAKDSEKLWIDRGEYSELVRVTVIEAKNEKFITKNVEQLSDFHVDDRKMHESLRITALAAV